MKPTKCPAKEKKKGKKSERRGKERKLRVEVKTAESFLNTKTISKFALCACQNFQLQGDILHVD